MLARRTALLLAGAICGTALGCLVDLDHRIACGDGFVDLEAGEECDPRDDDSFKDACRDAQLGDGDGQCDPVTCQIDVDETVCAKCNDGVLAPGVEECDLVAPANATCTAGGQPRCTECVVDYTTCLPYCGDGEVDPAEECDPGTDGGIAVEVSCTDDTVDGLARVPSAYGEAKLFGSGQTICDAMSCHWSRQSCSYCGNESVDDDPSEQQKDPYNSAVQSLPEWCDGELFSPVALADYDAVHDPGVECGEGRRPNVGCAPLGSPDACYAFVEHDDGQPCCVLTNELYPGDDADERCCWEYEHPGMEPWHSFGFTQYCN